MGDVRTIETVSKSLVHVLRLQYVRADWVPALQFEVYSRSNFNAPMDAGASLFLYRIRPNDAHRIPNGRRTAAGTLAPRLPLDLHYLLTIWAKDAGVQHRIAAWAMRALEDSPILDASILGAVGGGMHEHETVEVYIDHLGNEDLFRIWEIMSLGKGYQLSIPYVARNVRIDSERLIPEAESVRERRLDIVTVEAVS